MKHEIGSISSTNNDRGWSETEALSRLNTQRYLAGSGKAQCKGTPICVSVCSTGKPFSTQEASGRPCLLSTAWRLLAQDCTWTELSCSIWESTTAEKEQNPSCYCAGSDDPQLWSSFLILFSNSLAQAQFTFLAWVTSVLPLSNATGPFPEATTQ